MNESPDRLLPCPTCPWRINQDASVIPGYVHAKACNLMGTVGEGDDFRKIMACHHSTEDEPCACMGYIAVVGWTNINVRLLVARGTMASPDEAFEACQKAGIELHEDYNSVLAKLAASVGEDTTMRNKSLYDIPFGCICQGDGLFGMRCDATSHAVLRWEHRTTLDDDHETPSSEWWKRRDGAYVLYSSSGQDPNNENARFWLAFGPNERYLPKVDRRTKLNVPRRWKTAAAAMKALDTECPL